MHSENPNEHDGEKNGERGAAATEEDQSKHLLMELKNISKELREFKKEMTDNFEKLKQELKADMRQELAGFKEEINHKLEVTNAELNNLKKDMSKMQERMAETEAWNMEAKAAILMLLNQHDKTQQKLVGIESQNRRNSIRIFNCAEDAEKDSPTLTDFVEELFRRELSLPEEIELEIQRCRRATPNKPPDGANPRSIVVDFLQFESKECILKELWKKDIKVEGKRLSFDHDFAWEVLQKRKLYADIKKKLKHEGIGFSTPFTKIRVRWDDGPKVYDNPLEAARDMRRRGLEIHVKKPEATMEERIRAASQWQRVGDKEAILRRAREKLQEFRRAKD